MTVERGFIRLTQREHQNSGAQPRPIRSNASQPK